MKRRQPRPKCAYPPCGNRVKRAASKYCSHACSGFDRVGRPHDNSAAVAATRLRAVKDCIKSIVEECRPHLDANRRMPLDQVVKLVMRHRRVAYQRGYSLYYRRIHPDTPVHDTPRPSIHEQGVSPS
jgi:hypothetical protein